MHIINYKNIVNIINICYNLHVNLMKGFYLIFMTEFIIIIIMDLISGIEFVKKYKTRIITVIITSALYLILFPSWAVEVIPFLTVGATTCYIIKTYLNKNNNSFIINLCIAYLLTALSYFNTFNKLDYIKEKIFNFFTFDSTKKEYNSADFTYLKIILDNFTVTFAISAIIVIFIIIVKQLHKKNAYCVMIVIISPIIIPYFLSLLPFNTSSDVKRYFFITLKYLGFLFLVYTNYNLLGYIKFWFNELLRWLHEPPSTKRRNKLNTDNAALLWAILVFIFGLIYTKSQ